MKLSRLIDILQDHLTHGDTEILVDDSEWGLREPNVTPVKIVGGLQWTSVAYEGLLRDIQDAKTREEYAAIWTANELSPIFKDMEDYIAVMLNGDLDAKHTAAAYLRASISLII